MGGADLLLIPTSLAGSTKSYAVRWQGRRVGTAWRSRTNNWHWVPDTGPRFSESSLRALRSRVIALQRSADSMRERERTGRGAIPDTRNFWG